MKQSGILFIAALISFTINAQDSTFESVMKIFETSCNSESCHSSVSTHPLKLAGSIDDVYSNLIDKNPTNPAALNRGNKLIVPGDPAASFLYRKINNGLYTFDEIKDQEGTPMPIGGKISEVEKETIRQWILWGAPKEGLVHNEALLEEYYVDGNALERVEPLDKPKEGEGFQFYLGTLFLSPGEEIEIMKLVEIPLGDSLEITGFKVRMNEFSHHYGVARTINGFEDIINPGINIVDNFFTAFDFFNNSEYITGSQLPENNYVLPEDVAFRWEGSNFLNFNYHVKNYSSSAILPAEGYVNLYFQSKYTAEKEMKAKTVNYQPDNNPFALEIFPNGKDTTFVMEHYEEGSDEYIDIWRLVPHTHSYGVDYDIFMRNEDGSKGDQLYEGFYNYDLDFNRGYYDYSHATTRTFDEPIKIKMSEGLIFEATYKNTTDKLVKFGQTTDDEMFIGYYLYTNVDSSDIINSTPNNLAVDNQIKINAFPNPVKNKLLIETEDINTKASILIYDLNGKLVLNEIINTNNSIEEIDVSTLMNGVYFIEINDEENIFYTEKIIKQN